MITIKIHHFYWKCQNLIIGTSITFFVLLFTYRVFWFNSCSTLVICISEKILLDFISNEIVFHPTYAVCGIYWNEHFPHQLHFEYKSNLLISNFVYIFLNINFKTKSYCDLNYTFLWQRGSFLFPRSNNKEWF